MEEILDGCRTSAWVFPGQGSQYVPMGKELCDNFLPARGIFQEADDTLGYSLSSLCFEGPEALQLTANAQPAILTASVAWFMVLRERGLLADAAYVAGHSLGEYTALVAAGSLQFSDAVRLVRERGRLMQAAGNGNGRRSGMAAVMGIDDNELSEICAAVRAEREWSGIQVANFNSPGQTVISGSIDAVEAAGEMAKQRGAKRVIPLPVSAAFHSLLMKPVADELTKELARVVIQEPSVPLVANVTGKAMTDPAGIKNELILQTYSPVRWVDSVRFMLDAGVKSFTEVGPGKVLSGLIKRIERQTQTCSAEEMLGVGDLV